eukprot:224518-Pyramimonas_sp.AAC.1
MGSLASARSCRSYACHASSGILATGGRYRVDAARRHRERADASTAPGHQELRADLICTAAFEGDHP